MAFLPCVFVWRSYRTPPHELRIAARRRSHAYGGMLTIPPIASSFGASTGGRIVRSREIVEVKGERDGGCRGRELRRKRSGAETWHGIVLQTLKRNDIRLVPYVPDRVLTTLIKNLHADPFFTTFPTAREEEAVGIVSGAWMGGMRGAVLMQTSGFATLANVLASLVVPSQIPLIMFVSERGTLGEFNYGQSLVCRTMRPVLDSLGDGASHLHAARRVRVHRRPLDQAGRRHAGAGGADPLAAADRRQGLRQVSDRMTAPTNARNTKVMNRFDLTSRLVAKLKNEEAVIGGIGNTNFDLWAAGHRPQNFYMLGSMGLAFPIALGVALAQPKRRVFALEGDGSLLDAARLPVDHRDAWRRRTSP